MGVTHGNTVSAGFCKRCGIVVLLWSGLFLCLSASAAFCQTPSITLNSPQSGATFADYAEVKFHFALPNDGLDYTLRAYAHEQAGHLTALSINSELVKGNDPREGDRVWKWDTCALHNGAWEIVVEAEGGGALTQDSVSVTMQNLVIESKNADLFMLTNNDKSEYLWWNPFQRPLDFPTISFTLKDAQPKPTKVVWGIYSLFSGAQVRTPLRVIEWTELMTGSSHPVSRQWDGRDGNGRVMPPGVYAYDLVALHDCGNPDPTLRKDHDWYQRSSRFLCIPLPPDTFPPPHPTSLPSPSVQVTSYNETTEEGTVSIQYRLFSNQTPPTAPLTKGYIYDPDAVYDSNAQSIGSWNIPGGILAPASNVVERALLLRKAGYYPIVIQAYDNEKGRDKQHLSKPALECGPWLYTPPPAIGFAANDPGTRVIQNRTIKVFDRWDSTFAVSGNNPPFNNLSEVVFPFNRFASLPYAPVLGKINKRAREGRAAAFEKVDTIPSVVPVGEPLSLSPRFAAVWFFIGHGGGFRGPVIGQRQGFGVFFRDNGGDSNNPNLARPWSLLAVPQWQGHPLINEIVNETVFLSEGSLQHLLCVVLAGCDSAAGQGNLAQQFRALGARSVVGTTRPEEIVQLNGFTRRFWQYATKGRVDPETRDWSPQTVMQAARQAANEVRVGGNRIEGVVLGDQGIYLYPPRYGFQKP
jgi:hypothetical protein